MRKNELGEYEIIQNSGIQQNTFRVYTQNLGRWAKFPKPLHTSNQTKNILKSKS
jgi:hypothetical protein